MGQITDFYRFAKAEAIMSKNRVQSKLPLIVLSIERISLLQRKYCCIEGVIP